jgi:hypothetical protein
VRAVQQTVEEVVPGKLDTRETERVYVCVCVFLQQEREVLGFGHRKHNITRTSTIQSNNSKKKTLNPKKIITSVPVGAAACCCCASSAEILILGGGGEALLLSQRGL